MARKPKIDRFKEAVLSKFEIYNSLFLTLPFEEIKQTSVLLPLFSEHCRQAYEEKENNPYEIVRTFFKRYAPELKENEQHDVLFRFIQYIERQVVLFDAIEDAAFSYVNNMHGRGTLRYIKEEAQSSNRKEALKEHLNRFSVRIVLTAHPTQFYPDNVLVIINELANALASDDLENIKRLLAQLGKTPFYKKEKPTPYDEALSLIWYLENVFYQASSTIEDYISQHIFEGDILENPIFHFGFWPGGDRDGNPYVTPETTLKTAARLRFSVLRNYYRDLRRLKKKLTFRDVTEQVEELETAVFNELFYPEKQDAFSLEKFDRTLKRILAIVTESYYGLYAEDVKDLIQKLQLFGFFFASLDIRQDSRIHASVFETIVTHPQIHTYVENLPKDYIALSTAARIRILPELKGNVPYEIFEDTYTSQTLESIQAMRKIQTKNGEQGCHRYIISNCQTLENILQLFAMFRISNWENPTVDFIPLFETVNDLESAPEVMRNLFENPVYKAHLESRGCKQTIMLGFSDGTKDGGYFMANWSIYQAKESLSKLASENGIKVAFFDGRGGPPARGGGNTHAFYASLGNEIQADDIQLTVQGQTISSNFGTLDSAQFNLEQLLSAGVLNQVFDSGNNELEDAERETMESLAQKSYEAYQAFKSHPKFIPYLERMSTLPYYAKTNIGSRPTKRGKAKGLEFSDLRAIPFVGSWSLLKQNVPGFYGVGTALKHFESTGNFQKVQKLYENSKFFRTLVFNSMMSLTKSFFQLTAYMKEDAEFGAFWQMVYEEYELSKEMLLKVCGFSTLMENEPAGKASIVVRDQIVQPLLTIQQYALMGIQKNLSKDKKQVLERMITRSLFGNINASRNSA